MIDSDCCGRDKRTRRRHVTHSTNQAQFDHTSVFDLAKSVVGSRTAI